MQYTNTQYKRAFTLVELLVVVAVIALLLSVLLPSLQGARDQARNVKCKANLYDFGRGFLVYAQSHQDYLCSGAFDPEVSKFRDGPVDQVGWVADLVNSQKVRVGDRLCPTNPAKYNQKLGFDVETVADRYTVPEVKDLLARGYNTNYTQSWYMARTEMKQVYESHPGSEQKGTLATQGPLQVSRMLQTTPAVIPLLLDGAIDDDQCLDPAFGATVCVKTMSDGPFGGDFGFQDYDDMGPAHGMGSYRSKDKINTNAIYTNLLFGDGHVSQFEDVGDDKVFTKMDSPYMDPADESTWYFYLEFSQAEVFDGVISLGRRSRSSYQME
ncbi:MAG: hypothetical protein HJJLKODD_00185 [Phycisphaerae bacterium]|nr:hypothetical protein [Phycisphaerae bacterium]